ncbi:hypothetical protein J4466_04265 [Candidatus Pacearchaeota archaeon]|nr:hypothetical protein [Candidatus Pacearchaeota archaeon]
MNLKKILEEDPKGILVVRDRSPISYKDLEKMTIGELKGCNLSFRGIPAIIKTLKISIDNKIVKQVLVLRYCDSLYNPGTQINLSSPAVDLLDKTYQFFEFIYQKIKSEGKLN